LIGQVNFLAPGFSIAAGTDAGDITGVVNSPKNLNPTSAKAQ
jgi:hypothetical protein